MIDLEADILIKMGFDYNFPGPIQSLERFLRILKYDQNRTVYDMSYQICKFQLNDSMFLEYRPSQIAACSAIIAINIFERDQEQASKSGSNKTSSRKSSKNYGPTPNFFKSVPQGQLRKFNTDIWDNKEILSLTGYPITAIKEALY